MGSRTLLVGCQLNGSSFAAGTALAPIFLGYHLGPLGVAFTLNFTLKYLWLRPQRPGHTTDLSSSPANPGRWLSHRPMQLECHPRGEEVVGRNGPWWMKWKSEWVWLTDLNASPALPFLLYSGSFSILDLPSGAWAPRITESQSKTKENAPLSRLVNNNCPQQYVSCFFSYDGGLWVRPWFVVRMDDCFDQMVPPW